MLQDYKEYFQFAELEIESFRNLGQKRPTAGAIDAPRKRKKSSRTSILNSNILFLSATLASNAIIAAVNDIFHESFPVSAAIDLDWKADAINNFPELGLGVTLPTFKQRSIEVLEVRDSSQQAAETMLLEQKQVVVG